MLTNSILYGDCLQVMGEMPDECIDLIYLDPPYNTSKRWKGKSGAEFSDIFTMREEYNSWHENLSKYHKDKISLYQIIDSMFEEADKAYLIYMCMRLFEMHRILKNTGSIYYQLDPKMSHAVKLCMDCIFGKDSFRNEIIWCYLLGAASKKQWCRKHDVLLFYSKGESWTFNYRDAQREAKSRWAQQSGKRTVTDKDWWTVHTINNKEREIGYPTQKPIALLDKIIRASSNEGDIVLDPFCGSGTTLEAAYLLDRSYVGIDINTQALDIAENRITPYLKHGRMLNILD